MLHTAQMEHGQFGARLSLPITIHTITSNRPKLSNIQMEYDKHGYTMATPCPYPLNNNSNIYKIRHLLTRQ